MDSQVISALLDNKVLTYKDMHIDIINTDKLERECEIELFITKGEYKLRYTYFIVAVGDINTLCECIIDKAYRVVTEYIQGLEELNKDKEYTIEESKVGVLYRPDDMLNYTPFG